eukprot:2384059-Prymnesium_polylepis.1
MLGNHVLYCAAVLRLGRTVRRRQLRRLDAEPDADRRAAHAGRADAPRVGARGPLRHAAQRAAAVRAGRRRLARAV